MPLDNPGGLTDGKRQVLAGVRWHLSRREFLKAAATGAAALAGASMLGRRVVGAADTTTPVKTGTFFFPRLMFHVKDETGDQWHLHPIGAVILRKRLAELTNINVSQEAGGVKLADLDRLCRYPFVFATSEGYFDLPGNKEQNLKEFLNRGGFVLADDCVLRNDGDRFFRDYIKMINNLFPATQMREVPKDHEIYHCYFDFPDGIPDVRGTRLDAHGLFEKGTGRIMTYVAPVDLHCGWCCTYFAREKNEAAIRMGINIIIYYLTH